jgi:hypothetical protein
VSVPQARLYGCINDIVNVRNTLVDAYGFAPANINMLRDDVKSAVPTRANILAALANIIAVSSSPEDLVWIHYSGHGTQVRDTNKDETDGQDEAIVPSDYLTAGFITDDTLFDLLKTAKCRVLLFFDSCHSGTVCDLQYVTNMNAANTGIVQSVNNTKVLSNKNIVVMSGCRDVQTSADTYSTLEALGVGAFTDALLECLRLNDHNVDIKKLFVDVCGYLRKNGYTQIPVVSSTVATPVYQFARNNMQNTLRVTNTATSTATNKIRSVMNTVLYKKGKPTVSLLHPSLSKQRL